MSIKILKNTVLPITSEIKVLYMKEKILFLLLFIASSLSAMDEEQEKQQAERLWLLTHRADLCEKVNKGKVLWICPKKVQFEREKQLDRLSKLVGKISALKFVHKGDPKKITAYFRAYVARSEKLKIELSGLKEKIREETVKQFGAQEQLKVLDQLFGYTALYAKDYDLEKVEKKCKELKELGQKHCLRRLESDGVLSSGLACKIDGSVYKLLSELSKEKKEIESVTTYEHEKGDRTVVLCSTGEYFILVKIEKRRKTDCDLGRKITKDKGKAKGRKKRFSFLK